MDLCRVFINAETLFQSKKTNFLDAATPPAVSFQRRQFDKSISVYGMRVPKPRMLTYANDYEKIKTLING